MIRTLALVLLVAAHAAAQNGPPGPPPGPPPPPPGGPPPPPPGGPPPPPFGGPPPNEPAKRGLTKHEAGAQPGLTMIAPLHGKAVYLVDLDGRIVHRWDAGFEPGSEIFTDDGHLLRCCQQPDAPRFKAGGACGRLQEFDWDGKLTWDYVYATDEHLQHHDLELLPDGNVLFIAYEYKAHADCIAAGRHPSGVGKDGLWAETVLEVEPTRPSGGEIIWEWHLWDHLIQDVDQDAENFGDVAAHPELLDANADLRREPTSDSDVEQMKKLGYIAANPTAGELNADWLHVNAIDYDAVHDQILLSSPHLSEIWIIDHSTTSDEATGHSGGSSKHGGDLLWRWGNPRDFGAGTSKEETLYGQHDPRFIRDGLAGAGHVTVFNNGARRPDGNWSSILELALPRKPDGTFELELGLPFGPTTPAWSYTAPTKTDFFSGFISGATRLPNGNTQICEGASGRVFEVTPQGETVWEFLNPWGDVEPNMSAPQFSLFRATRIPADHPGLKGRKLEPIVQ